MATLVQHILYQEAMDVGPLRSPRSGRLIWDLDASEVGGLNSIPFPLLPAQGVGTVIMPVAGSYQYKAGSVPFAVAAALRVAPWTADPTDGGLRTGTIALDGITSKVGRFGGQEDPSSRDQADAENLPLLLFASEDPGASGVVTAAGVDGGGSGFLVGDEITLEEPDGGGTAAVLAVATVEAPFAITAVDDGDPFIFTVAGDRAAEFTGSKAVVTGSTGNDGVYTVVSAVFDTDHTDITVEEAIPDPTVDGSIGRGAASTVTIASGGTNYPVGSTPEQDSTTGSGVSFQASINAVDSATDGRLRVVIDYEIMELLT